LKIPQFIRNDIVLRFPRFVIQAQQEIFKIPSAKKNRKFIVNHNQNVLEAQNVSRTYTIEDRTITVLDDISFSVPAGEFLVIEGRSGSGKSTLLTLLSGLDRPTSGSLRVNGDDITRMTEDQLAPLRNRSFGFVFQAFHLVPSLNALENIMFPAELNNDRSAEKRARELMKQAGLEARAQNFPHQLSGGEKQRVGICRALINRPGIIFADEPTGNLDSENSDAILGLLMDIRKEQKITLVMVTHNAEIAGMADRVIRLQDGKIAGERRTAQRNP